MRPVIGIAVIGAGPYGLSVATHLSALGLKPRVFGVPMQTWRQFMPEGMVLKSEGFAMNLSDPDGRYTLAAFCAEQGLPYKHIGWPVPVETFAAYGLAFQKRFVPQVEPLDVTRVELCDEGFAVTLESGETFTARHVVMATGIRPFSKRPEQLATLPISRVTHSADQGEMSALAGRRVVVLGGGASAMDVAASAHRAGARTTVVSRTERVRFYSPVSFRSRRDRLIAPMTTLGPGWKKYLCVRFPDLFHLLPPAVRTRILGRYLGPSPAWSTRDVIEKHVDVRVQTELRGAAMDGGDIVLTLADTTGATETLRADHVIAATGYRVDLGRLSMLSNEIRAAIRCEDRNPSLSSHFESSVKNLFFVGTQSAINFGPMLRFVCGTDFAARRVARQIAASEQMSEASGDRRSKRNTVHVWKPTGDLARS